MFTPSTLNIPDFVRYYQRDAVKHCFSSEKGIIQLPTGSGKTFVIANAVTQYADNGFKICLILSPRIALTNQLATDIVRFAFDKSSNMSLLTVHSGRKVKDAIEHKTPDFDDDTTEHDMLLEKEIRKKIANFNVEHAMTVEDIETSIKNAQHFKKMLLICATYQSCAKVTFALENLGLTVDHCFCDEAHYITEEDKFKEVDNVDNMCNRIHFFTATTKENDILVSNEKLAVTGMQNKDFYGERLMAIPPKELISQGFILSPRYHLVTTDEVDADDVSLIIQAFDKHLEVMTPGIEPKLLINTAGSQQIAEVLNNKTFQDYVRKNDVKVFSITSDSGSCFSGQWRGCYIDGEKILDRDQFIKEMREYEGRAIVLHIRILTEGIDVPNFTGVMFMRSVKIVNFLQTIGRAMRVRPDDAAKGFDKFDEWRKKEAYVIMPLRANNIGDGELNATIHSYLELMHSGDLRPQLFINGEEYEGIKDPEDINWEREDNEKRRTVVELTKECIHKMQEMREVKEKFNIFEKDIDKEIKY